MELLVEWVLFFLVYLFFYEYCGALCALDNTFRSTGPNIVAESDQTENNHRHKSFSNFTNRFEPIDIGKFQADHDQRNGPKWSIFENKVKDIHGLSIAQMAKNKRGQNFLAPLS